MKRFVIDTSVFMKLFLEEDDSEKAVRFFIHANEHKSRFLIPALFQSEFLSVIKKRNIAFDEAYDLLEDYLSTSWKRVEDSKAIMKKALEISRHGHDKSGYPSVYDSVYHALAMLNDCDFITADRRHYEKTKELGHVKLLADMDMP